MSRITLRPLAEVLAGRPLGFPPSAYADAAVALLVAARRRAAAAATPRALVLALAAATMMFSLAWLGIELTRQGGRVASVWLANAAIIALLLRSARAHWPTLLLGSFGGNIACGLVVGDPPALAVALAACNLVEILVVTILFARRFPRDAALDSIERLGWLGLLAIVGPLLSTPLAGASLLLLGGDTSVDALFHWLAADSLGIVVLLPLLLGLSGPRRDPDTDPRHFEFLLVLALALTTAYWVFTRTTSSLFLLTPVLVFAGLRLRMHQAAVMVLGVCAIALALTYSGNGPLALPIVSESMRIFLLQAFMATTVMLTMPVAALIAERDRASQALRLREELYRLLADHSSDLVLRLDNSGGAGFVSSAARRLIGVAPEELAGAALYERLHPEDLLRFAAALERSRRNGEAVACFRMRHVHGQYRWIEAHYRRADDGPAGMHAGAIVATLRDVHQRRTAEMLAAQSSARMQEANRLLVMAEELAALGHWYFDPTRREFVLSSEAATLLDLPVLTMSATEAMALVNPADRRDLMRSLVVATRDDRPGECIVRVASARGERTLQLRVQRPDENVRGGALFGVVSDITDKLAAERRLVAAVEEARSAAAFRSQFLATMSHEIRTPMTGVIGMIELLEASATAAERRLYLDTLRHSADLLMAVLNDILDYSKVDAGRLVLADEPFDVGQVLATTLRLFDRAASSRGLALRLEGPAPGDLWLRGDALRLQQILSNLLNNAIKFSERGEVVLRCAATPIDGDDRRTLSIAVIDSGVGISAELQSELFEPFVQGVAGSARGGTGLGLAISRRLVDAMGGTIALQSVEDVGSTFTVSLALPVAAASPEGPRLVRAYRPGRPLDLLLAEDNPVNQLLVTALLRRMGHRVTCAPDGLAAVAAAEARPFDAILMDMQMPRCDGLAATRAIRSGNGPCARIPIIALTADAASERRPLYTQSGIDALLTKPIDSAALSRQLSALSDLAPASPPAARPAAPGPKSSPALDPATLEEMAAILGAPRLDHLLLLLRAELEERPRAIRDALADGDLSRAAHETHSLKGAAANLGATAVAAAALALEQAIAAARNGDRRRLAPALRRLGQCCTGGIAAIAERSASTPAVLPVAG